MTYVVKFALETGKVLSEEYFVPSAMNAECVVKASYPEASILDICRKDGARK